MEIKPEQLAELGEIADSADNFAAGATLPMPLHIHKRALTGAMKDLRDRIKELYVAISGENPWEE